MKLIEKKLDNVVILKADAERIFNENSKLFKSLLLEEAEKYNRIALDLSNISVMDSTGLGAIISFYKAVKHEEDFVIFGLQDKVKTLFDLTRLSRIFTILDDEKDVNNYFSIKNEEDF